MSWSLLWEGDVTAVAGLPGDLIPEEASYGGSDDDHDLAVASFHGAIAMAQAAGFERAKVIASGHVATDPEPHGEQSLRVTGVIDGQDVELGGAGEHEGPVGPEQTIGPHEGPEGVRAVPGTGDPEHPDHVPG